MCGFEGACIGSYSVGHSNAFSCPQRRYRLIRDQPDLAVHCERSLWTLTHPDSSWSTAHGCRNSNLPTPEKCCNDGLLECSKVPFVRPSLLSFALAGLAFFPERSLFAATSYFLSSVFAQTLSSLKFLHQLTTSTHQPLL